MVRKPKGEIKIDELLSTTGAQNTNDVDHINKKQNFFRN